MKVYENMKGAYISLFGKNLGDFKAGDNFDVILLENQICLKKRNEEKK